MHYILHQIPSFVQYFPRFRRLFLSPSADFFLYIPDPDVILWINLPERSVFAMIDRPSMKREARELLRGAKVNPYLFALLFIGISLLLNSLRTYVTGVDEETMEIVNALRLELPSFLVQRNFPPMLVLFVSVSVFLLTAVLNGGWALYHLGIRRGRKMPFSTLLEGLTFAGKLILLDLVMSLFIALWAFLFVIPGIIAAYRYRFALYNLCENPSVGVMEAIDMSKIQTSGCKWSLFILDLSFLGWLLLSVFTAGILDIWILPYREQTNVGYFMALKASSGVGYHEETDGAPFDDGLSF